VPTIDSIVRGRVLEAPIEIVIVDDASSDGTASQLATHRERWDRASARLKVVRLPEHSGVPCARNYGAASARGTWLFITDAHVRFPHGWDVVVMSHEADQDVLCATIVDERSGFAGHGCTLDFPSMGTRWLRDTASKGAAVPIAPCAGTVVPSSLFWGLGGYDALMPLYGAAEPEFSVRLWRAGARIRHVPALQIRHAFRRRDDHGRFQDAHRSVLVHNALRFALLHLPSQLVLRVIRYYAEDHPDETRHALDQLRNGDVWLQRGRAPTRFPRRFEWFARRFDLRDRDGRRLCAGDS
jgi:glycosyltransferase involved in cell wall biosynthesis